MGRRAGAGAGYVLIVCAGLGAVADGWRKWTPGAKAKAEREEIALLAFLRRWALVIVACALVFSLSAMWAGIVRPGDFNNVSIGDWSLSVTRTDTTWALTTWRAMGFLTR